jgi:DNA-binding XRE family transcriptional regulator
MVRRLRGTKTQAELARRVGVSRSAIGSAEVGVVQGQAFVDAIVACFPEQKTEITELYANAVNAAPRRRGGRKPLFEEDVELRRAMALIGRGRPTEAASILEYLAEQTAEPTKLVRMWRYLGDARFALGHREEAFDAYRRGIFIADESRLQSDGTELRNLLAGHLTRLDRFDEALVCRRRVKTDPLSPVEN